MYGRYAFFMRAMGTTEKISAGLDTMANNLAVAMIALRRQRVNRAFKAIKIVGDARYYDFQRFVVVITANFTACHNCFLTDCFCL